MEQHPIDIYILFSYAALLFFPPVYISNWFIRRTIVEIQAGFYGSQLVIGNRYSECEGSEITLLLNGQSVFRVLTTSTKIAGGLRWWISGYGYYWYRIDVHSFDLNDDWLWSLGPILERKIVKMYQWLRSFDTWTWTLLVPIWILPYTAEQILSMNHSEWLSRKIFNTTILLIGPICDIRLSGARFHS